MNTQVGLCHHTEGTIVGVEKNKGQNDILLVEFKDYRGKLWLQNDSNAFRVFNIIPITMISS